MAIDYWGKPYCSTCGRDLTPDGTCESGDPTCDVNGELVCIHREEPGRMCLACRVEGGD